MEIQSKMELQWMVKSPINKTPVFMKKKFP